MALGVGGLVMTINELIQELKKYNGDAEVYHLTEYDDELRYSGIVIESHDDEVLDERQSMMVVIKAN